MLRDITENADGTVTTSDRFTGESDTYKSMEDAVKHQKSAPVVDGTDAISEDDRALAQVVVDVLWDKIEGPVPEGFPKVWDIIDRIKGDGWVPQSEVVAARFEASQNTGGNPVRERELEEKLAETQKILDEIIDKADKLEAEVSDAERKTRDERRARQEAEQALAELDPTGISASVVASSGSPSSTPIITPKTFKDRNKMRKLQDILYDSGKID